MSKHSSDVFYGLGFVGALVYNMQQAQGLSQVLWGILEAVLWPAFLIYKVFSLLQL